MMVGRKRRAPLMMFGGWGSVRSDYNCPAQSESTHPALRECGECQVTKFWPQILHNAATTSHIRHWFGRLAPPPAGQRVHNGPSIWRSSLFIFHQCQLDFSLVTQFATTSHRQIGGAYCRAVIGGKCTYRQIQLNAPNTVFGACIWAPQVWLHGVSLKCSSRNSSVALALGQ